MIQPSE